MGPSLGFQSFRYLPTPDIRPAFLIAERTETSFRWWPTHHLDRKLHERGIRQPWRHFRRHDPFRLWRHIRRRKTQRFVHRWTILMDEHYFENLVSRTPNPEFLSKPRYNEPRYNEFPSKLDITTEFQSPDFFTQYVSLKPIIKYPR